MFEYIAFFISNVSLQSLFYIQNSNIEPPFSQNTSNLSLQVLPSYAIC